MLIEELKHIDSSEQAVKKNGITVGLVLITIAFILWWLGKNSFIYFFAIGATFIILSYIAIHC
jgi:fucose permease